MAEIIRPRKNLAINPLKMSPPLGGALAFMGLAGCVPLLHGSQGCTAFGKVLMVRHFREASPIQTTAMNEITTILGGIDNLEQGCLNVFKRTGCAAIGILTTGLTEARGEDLAGDLKLIRRRNPELAGVELIGASTPDFSGGVEWGWGRTVTAIVETLVAPATTRETNRINILAGNHLTCGDIEEIRDLVEAFGLTATILPDLSGSLDGHIPDTYTGTSLGGTTVEEIRAMGRASFTFAIGEQMRAAALALEKRAGVPFAVIDRLTGLRAVDDFVSRLMSLSGREPPAPVKRRRSQLVDAMLDGHFQFGGAAVALAAEPDLLFGLSSFLAEMGATIAGAVSSSESPVLAGIPAREVIVGDLDDLETAARENGARILITHSHGRMAAERLGLPLFHAGFPIFDRLGAQHRAFVGYRGTRDLIFALGNMLFENAHESGMPHHGDGVRTGEGSGPHAQAATH